jgi:hypothetical protein
MMHTHRTIRRAACALLAFTAAPLAAQTGGPDSRPVVAVLDYINASMRRDADYAALSKGIAVVLAGRLGENPTLRIVTREKLRDVLAEQDLGASGRVDPGQAVQVGKILGAHHIVYGTYLVQPNGDMRLTAQAYSVETTEQEYSASVRGSADKLQDLLDQLADKMIAGLRLPAAPIRVGAPGGAAKPAAGTGNLGDLVILSKAIAADDRKAPAEAVPLYKMFLSKAPSSSFAVQRRMAEERIAQSGM